VARSSGDGKHWAWESQIDAWEPGKRLRLIENRPAFDINGEPLAGPSQQMAMEFTLEAWMTTYDARHAARVREFGARAQRLIERLFQ
jgi:hypothetical protein